MKLQQQMSVRVHGRGDTHQKAFADALSSVQRTILKDTSNIILRIEPVDVSVVKAQKSVKKEKFLFFFLARERELYSITLDVVVDLTMINTQEIQFELTNKK